MSLHTIPLCNFIYVGDIYSGATFRYDTTAQTSKAGKLKLLCEDTTKKIEKNNTKLLRSGSNMSIVKSDSKFLRRNNYDIGKYIFKFLEVENRYIDISSSIFLKEFRNIILNINSSAELENIADNTIDIERSSNFERINNYVEFNLESNKNLQEFRRKWIIKNNSLINITRKNLLFNLIVNNVYTNKLSYQAIDKDKSVISVLVNKTRFIDKLSERYFNRIYFIQSFLYKNKFYERCKLRDINKDRYMFMDRIMLNDMSYRNTVFNLKRNVLRNVFIFRRLINMDRVTIKSIARNLKTELLRKVNRKALSIIEDGYGLNRLAFNYIFKDSSKLLRRYTEKNIYFDHCIWLDREIIVEINRMRDVYLKDTSFINIYQQSEKLLLDVTISYILKNESYSLGSFNRNLYKEVNNNKFISVIKRWWWLNPTAPKDNLIIPDKDFSYNQELLNNVGYEYLRFTNHPICWGNNWGIDWSIPAYAVSVEIMLDLVNILIMIWYDNVQGWLCCSGKESIQFVMELLYDWYTLGISEPNADYYRAYRWIRWEAEKVYFLNLDNGLRAVGMFIANLIDYLKNHEFNLVPLWRNPKAMDIERNFNRIGQNGDLMKVLDKAKGKRYYYIETQNIEKKNMLGDDINGSNS